MYSEEIRKQAATVASAIRTKGHLQSCEQPDWYSRACIFYNSGLPTDPAERQPLLDAIIDVAAIDTTSVSHGPASRPRDTSSLILSWNDHTETKTVLEVLDRIADGQA